MNTNQLNTISIVIPTFKRVDSLKRLLKSIERQTLLPKEVTIVVSGIPEAKVHQVIKNYNLPFNLIFSAPSVCKQRNMGINKSISNYILLCDDDIELPENYLKMLNEYLDNNPNVKIVSGEETLLVSENNWKPLNQKISQIKLIYNYIFCLPFWSDLKENNFNPSFIIRFIIKKYNKKGNSISKAGWPIMCDFSNSVIKTSIYSLQAAMIRSHDLKQNLFDENLTQNGYGDNYDVAIRINGLDNKIHVLTNSSYKHYKVKSNRLNTELQYYYRTKALFTFVQNLPDFSLKNQLFFLWSLTGNGILFLFNGKLNYFYTNLKVGLFAVKKIVNI